MRESIVHGGNAGFAIRLRLAGSMHSSGPRWWLREALNVVKVWRDRAVSRAQLGQLDERLLRDVGLDAVQAAEEARKPFWEA